MRLYELILEDDNDGVSALSFVSSPAIELDFVFFGTEHKFQSINDEKRLVVGPILIPNKKILRVDGSGVPYEVYLSPETVAKIAHNYMKNGYQNEATLEHDKKVENISLVESWIVESRDKDKSKLYNMNLPMGSWAGVFKIDNDEMWNEYIKTGRVKGISIEGIFAHLEKTPENQKESAYLMESMADFLLEKSIEELNETEAEIVLSKIKAVLEQPSITSTYPGESASSGSYVSPATFQDEYINIYGYVPEYFHICPGAVGTFNHLVNEMDIQEKDLQDMIRAAAVIADNVFDIEEDAVEDGEVDVKDLERAKVLVGMFKDIFLTINERTGMQHDISYMDGHIKVLEDIYANRGLEQIGI